MRSSGSRRPTSARFTASAPTCCANVRSRRASIRCSRCSPKPRAEPDLRRGVPRLAARAAGGSARGRPPGAAPQRLVARRPRQRRRAGRSPSPGGARAGRVARLRRRLAPRSVRSRRGCCSACSRAIHELAALTAAPLSTARSAVSGHRAGPRAEPRRRRRRRASTPPIPTAGKRASSTSRRTGTSGAPAAAASAPTAPASARDVVWAAYESLIERARRVPARRRLRSRRAAARGAARGASRGYEQLKQRAGALDFVDLLLRARDLLDAPPARPPGVPVALHAHLRRRVPGHRSAAGRDPAAARGRRSGGERLAPRHARSRQAVHRRRSEAGDLPLPARRRRDLPRGVRAARVARCAAAPSCTPASARRRRSSARSTRRSRR